jgi:hypothetical protein
MLYVVALQGAGYALKHTLNQLNVSTQQKWMAQGLISDLDFAYNEITSQVLLALSPDIPAYLLRLENDLPDFRYLECIDVFNLPRSQVLLKEAVKLFGVEILACVNSHVGIQLGFEYLLESIGPDFMIVRKVPAYTGG